MYPNIYIGTSAIPTFSLCVIVGIVVCALLIIFTLRKYPKPDRETYFILPKLFIAFGVGFVFSILFDAMFKIPQNGGFKLAGMTFYGGLVAGLGVLALLIFLFRKNTKFTLLEWLNFLTVPFILFHFFGRVGCFLGGCCYGSVTEGPFGLYFPDNPASGIYHHGHKVYPTQLFEAAGLLAIAITLILVKKHKFVIYCLSYPVLRFLIEFLRGDNRGSYFGFLSPAQLISVLILTATLIVLIIKLIKLNKKTE